MIVSAVDTASAGGKGWPLPRIARRMRACGHANGKIRRGTHHGQPPYSVRVCGHRCRLDRSADPGILVSYVLPIPLLPIARYLMRRRAS
jgi:hypothetical protein